ncbi:UNVERIFIED_CONTAM: hypothetical protein Sradi_6242200 [Sesamum radiatum]|uniref:RNase H type-1 domain-containing protein n=1 Tax=Sesamum radiatum TaxID=300843 RepID=A0AAW2KB70_SESRA
MERRTLDPDQVISHARHYYSAFLSQMGDLMARPRTTTHDRWSPPPVNVVKINFDGALFVNEGESGIGVVAHDSAGSCLAWLSHGLPNCLSPELVEAKAAREALSMAQRLHWRRIILEGDCLPLLQKLKSLREDYSATGPITSDIFHILSVFNCVSFSFIKRSGNSVAHSLARTSFGLQGVGDLPPTALAYLLSVL